MPAWLFSNFALWSIFHRKRCIRVQRRRTESIWLLFHLSRLSLLPFQDRHCPWGYKIWQCGWALRGGAAYLCLCGVTYQSPWIERETWMLPLPWQLSLLISLFLCCAETSDCKAAADGSDWRPCPWKWLVSVWIIKLFWFVAQPHNCNPWHKGGRLEHTVWSRKESGNHKSWQQYALKLA